MDAVAQGRRSLPQWAAPPYVFHKQNVEWNGVLTLAARTIQEEGYECYPHP